MLVNSWRISASVKAIDFIFSGFTHAGLFLPPACDLQTFLLFSQHPAWLYYAGKPIVNVVYCLNKLSDQVECFHSWFSILLQGDLSKMSQVVMQDFSTYGTFVNGDKISGSVFLKSGDEILFGKNSSYYK